ncbi:hypothetical protein DE4576_04861 [Mycobacterium marinum]|uniref:hypothetical protein n=1 Tax=Mycobacterium marinum TaxID=1781 RepID=UPI000E3ECDF3|nr:hypothetical protein [Mycobacterium marinum]RFZ63220.1 hypothetical protein DE4576_04861 [Mycobacterium marinum]
MANHASARSLSLDISPAIAAARAYSREVKIACDELHGDPFNRNARALLLKLIVDDSPEADAAFTCALAENSAGIVED